MADLRSDLEALRDELKSKPSKVNDDFTEGIVTERGDTIESLTAILASHPAGPDLRELQGVASEALNALLDYVPTLEKQGGSMYYGRSVIKRLSSALLSAYVEAGEWRGPWKCEKCNDVFPHYYIGHGNTERGGVCLGTLVPYERRKGGA